MEKPRVLLAQLLLLCVLRFGSSQHYYALRPEPSDVLPLVELHEDPDPALDPGERDLNATALRRALGHLDARFLSVSPPPPPTPPPPSVPQEREPERHHHAGGSGDDLGPGPRRRKKMMMLKQHHQHHHLLQDHQNQQHEQRQKMKKKKKRRRRLWLLRERERALCPVAHAWSDLGARFWPRYVRLGSCSRERSCSVPAGMLCAPAASTHVTLLRWRCARRGAALRCAWIRVHYPVITECKCSCPAGS